MVGSKLGFKILEVSGVGKGSLLRNLGSKERSLLISGQKIVKLAPPDLLNFRRQARACDSASQQL